MPLPNQLFIQLAAQNPELASKIAAAAGVDLTQVGQSLQGGAGADQMTGGSVGDVLAGSPSAAPAPSPPTVPVGQPVPKPAGAPTAPPAPEPPTPTGAPPTAALAGLGQALLPSNAAAQPRAPAPGLQLSRGISDTGGLAALLGVAGQAPQGQIPLAALLRGIG